MPRDTLVTRASVKSARYLPRLHMRLFALYRLRPHYHQSLFSGRKGAVLGTRDRPFRFPFRGLFFAPGATLSMYLNGPSWRHRIR